MAHKNPKRFGQVAVEKGFLNEEHIIKALDLQVMDKIEGRKHRLLGAILVDQGWLTDDQVEEILDAMNNQMMYMLAVGR